MQKITEKQATKIIGITVPGVASHYVFSNKKGPAVRAGPVVRSNNVQIGNNDRDQGNPDK